MYATPICYWVNNEVYYVQTYTNILHKIIILFYNFGTQIGRKSDYFAFYHNMEPDDITPKLLKQTLRAYRHGQNPPHELLNLQLLGDTKSSSERGVHLFEILISIGLDSLSLHRQMTGLKHVEDPNISREEQLSNLSLDFSIGDPDLEAWSAVFNRYLAPNTFRVSELANAAHVAPRQYRRRVERGLSYLVTALRQAEIELPTSKENQHLSRHLPAPDYIRLFGVEETMAHVIDLLTNPNGPKFVSLEGLGGIGKTALAQAVAWKLAEKGNLSGIPWISARHEWLSNEGFIQKLNDPIQSTDDIISRLTAQVGQEQLAGLPTQSKLDQIQPLLSKEPHLVIIDNLESMTDIKALIPNLYCLAGASRFLFTSRTTLRSFPFVQIVSMKELTFQDSKSLLESELKRRGRAGNISSESMKALYNTIGGHPLALKLASAHMVSLPLEFIIKGLQKANQNGPEAMYTYIYRQTWKLLSEPAKKLLLSMLMVSPDGESLDWIQIMSALPIDEFDQALKQLMDYSLLEISGRLDSPYYRLHRLTVTFLQTDILSTWQTSKNQ